METAGRQGERVETGWVGERERERLEIQRKKGVKTERGGKTGRESKKTGRKAREWRR